MENIEKKLEELILKAQSLGIQFKKGPASWETINDPKIFHVLEEMTDEIFVETLSRTIDKFESKKFLSVLEKHSLFATEEVTAPTEEK